MSIAARAGAAAAVLLLIPSHSAAAADSPATAPSSAWIAGSRLALVSAPFVGRPYRLDPLGEGATADIDADPLWRSDAFDCLTFVETVIALARSATHEEAQQELQRLRYADGQIGFGTRNHFPDADWIPNNLRAGAVADVTSAVAAAASLAPQLSVARGVVRRAAWLRGLPRNPLQAANPRLAGAEPRAVQALERLAEQARDQTVELPYLRLRTAAWSQLRGLVAALPDGAVIFIVRPNTSLLGRVGAVTQISHVGLALRDAAGTVVYRNASSGRAKRVLDEPLLAYLQRMQTTRSFAGIVVLRVLTRQATEQMP